MTKTKTPTNRGAGLLVAALVVAGVGATNLLGLAIADDTPDHFSHSTNAGLALGNVLGLPDLLDAEEGLAAIEKREAAAHDWVDSWSEADEGTDEVAGQ